MSTNYMDAKKAYSVTNAPGPPMLPSVASFIIHFYACVSSTSLLLPTPPARGQDPPWMTQDNIKHTQNRDPSVNSPGAGGHAPLFKKKISKALCQVMVLCKYLLI